MKTIFSDSFELSSLSAREVLQVYNGLDCCITFKVFKALEQQLQTKPLVRRTFEFERDMQAPALEMMLRGFLVDKDRSHEVMARARRMQARLQDILDKLWTVVFDVPPEKHFLANSPTQIKLFLKRMSVKARTTDAEELEKIGSAYYWPQLAIRTILKYRAVTKTIGVLKSAVDSDDRMRSSYNVAGTITGRWSSKKNAWGTGTNLQNITEELRDIFVPDPGKKLAYIDLNRAESVAVAFLSGDENYIRVCKEDDLHLEVAKMVWPELPWGTAPDKEIGAALFYRHHSYRFTCKALGHGSNYMGTAHGLNRATRVPIATIKEFQDKYFSAFPGIRRWQKETCEFIRDHKFLVTPFGRRRDFLDRTWEIETWKSGVAFLPQSVVGDGLNQGLLQLWRARLPSIEILSQNHDAVTFQYDPELESEILPQAMALLRVVAPVNGRLMEIEVSAKVGWNWREFDADKNPQGLKDWHGPDSERRKGQEAAGLLDSGIHGVHERHSDL